MDAKRDTTTPVNSLRADILDHVRSCASEKPGLFTLTVPTDGGKTLASLGFALDHARLYRHERVIYAIPFTPAWIETGGWYAPPDTPIVAGLAPAWIETPSPLRWRRHGRVAGLAQGATETNSIRSIL